MSLETWASGATCGHFSISHLSTISLCLARFVQAITAAFQARLARVPSVPWQHLAAQPLKVSKSGEGLVYYFHLKVYLNLPADKRAKCR